MMRAKFQMILMRYGELPNQYTIQRALESYNGETLETL